MGELRKGPMLAPVTAGSPHHGYPRQHSSSSHCSTGVQCLVRSSTVLLFYCSTGLQCLVYSSTVLVFYCSTVLLQLQCLVSSTWVQTLSWVERPTGAISTPFATSKWNQEATLSSVVCWRWDGGLVIRIPAAAQLLLPHYCALLSAGHLCTHHLQSAEDSYLLRTHPCWGFTSAEDSSLLRIHLCWGFISAEEELGHREVKPHKTSTGWLARLSRPSQSRWGSTAPSTSTWTSLISKGSLPTGHLRSYHLFWGVFKAGEALESRRSTWWAGEVFESRRSTWWWWGLVSIGSWVKEKRSRSCSSYLAGVEREQIPVTWLGLQ